jgi:hypothetical protein
MALDKSKLFEIPILGYALHLVDALFRLPRNDDRIKELRLAVKALEAGASGGGSFGPGRACVSKGRDQDLPQSAGT